MPGPNDKTPPIGESPIASVTPVAPVTTTSSPLVSEAEMVPHRKTTEATIGQTAATKDLKEALEGANSTTLDANSALGIMGDMLKGTASSATVVAGVIGNKLLGVI
jgi:hypothetical protein